METPGLSSYPDRLIEHLRRLRAEYQSETLPYTVGRTTKVVLEDGSCPGLMIGILPARRNLIEALNKRILLYQKVWAKAIFDVLTQNKAAQKENVTCY